MTRARSGAWPVAAVLVATAVVRVWLLLSPALEPDADESVTGVMARRILEGHHRAFFAGQAYMGTAEQYLQAAMLAVLPDSSFTMRVSQVALAVAACWLVHRLAVACGLSSARSLLAAALFAVGPYFPAYWGAKSRGAYGLAMVLGLLGLVLALRIERAHRWALPGVALFGLVGGLGFWSNQQTAYLLVPAGWWLVATMRGRWAAAGLAGAAGFVVGAAPALWHSMTTADPLFGAARGASSIAERASHFVTGTLPDLLGVRDDGEPLLSWLPPSLVVLAAVLVLGAAVLQHRSGILEIARLRRDRRTGIALLLVVVVLMPALYLQSGVATTATARFVFVVYGVLPVLAAALPLPGWLAGRTSTRSLAALAVVLVAWHTWAGAGRFIAQDDGGHQVASGQVVRGEDMDDVVRALRAAGAGTAYADYWLAHPLNWEADGTLLVESLSTRRFPHISGAVEADPSPALVVADGELADVRAALDGRGATYDVTAAAGWWVITGIEPGIHLPWVGSAAEGIRAAP